MNCGQQCCQLSKNEFFFSFPLVFSSIPMVHMGKMQPEINPTAPLPKCICPSGGVGQVRNSKIIVMFVSENQTQSITNWSNPSVFLSNHAFSSSTRAGLDAHQDMYCWFDERAVQHRTFQHRTQISDVTNTLRTLAHSGNREYTIRTYSNLKYKTFNFYHQSIFR